MLYYGLPDGVIVGVGVGVSGAGVIVAEGVWVGEGLIVYVGVAVDGIEVGVDDGCGEDVGVWVTVMAGVWVGGLISDGVGVRVMVGVRVGGRVRVTDTTADGRLISVAARTFDVCVRESDDGATLLACVI